MATARAKPARADQPILAPLKMHEQKGVVAEDLSQAPEYARPLRPHWVAYLARNWNPRLVGELLVSHRAEDDTWRLMTGNHRWAAALLRKERDFYFPCLVHYGLTVQEEAEVYLAQDRNRLRHTAADDFLAMLTQGDPVAQGIDAVVKDLGLHITPYGMAGYGKTRIRAVSALLRTWETAGEARLRDALELIRDEWLPGIMQAPGRRTAFSEATLLPLAVFLKLYWNDPAFKLANLRQAMEREGLAEYERKYMAQRTAAAARPTAGVATLYGVLALVDTYNYGRRLDNRLDETVARKSAQTRFGEERANQPFQATGTRIQADAKHFIATLEEERAHG